ncbi:hypothetical protein ACFYWN_12060 [Streptomyces sp. NPDC002917]|uniref:hypothetical protein n=1 Tax=Streptomyces sp. NPDC002917 TaxID=3364671 RepID=UPI0036AF9A04
MNGAAEVAAFAALVVIVTGIPTGVWASTPDRRARRRADRHLARLARTTGATAMTLANDEQRDPDYCWTCGRKCGSQAH